MRRVLFVPLMLAGFAIGLALPVGAIPAPADPVPHCEHVSLQENSGNGPDYRVLICGALQRSDGEGWQLIVDGGPLQNGAVIFGYRQP